MKHSELIGNLTILELKALIRQALYEYDEDKKTFSDTEYKALWVKPPTTTGGIV